MEIFDLLSIIFNQKKHNLITKDGRKNINNDIIGVRVWNKREVG
jgi:hypothetical protein